MIEDARYEIARDAEFIRPFLAVGCEALLDPDLLVRGPDSGLPDVLNGLLDIFRKLTEEPDDLRFIDIETAARADGSQIGNPEAYLAHISGVSYLARKIQNMLFIKDELEAAFNPMYIQSLGLLHDLSKIFSRYGSGQLDGRPVEFRQYDLELTQYIISTVLGLNDLQEISLHCAYYELAHLIADGIPFQGSDLYVHWQEAFNDPKNRFHIGQIDSDFMQYLGGDSEITPLKIISVADHCQFGKPVFDLETIRGKHLARLSDIVYRYYVKHFKEGNQPSGLGIALVEKGGADRVTGYLNQIIT